MELAVSQFIRTSEERTLFLSELDQVENSLFKTDSADDTDLASLHIRRETLSYWLDIVRQKIGAKQTLEELRTAVMEMPMVRLTLAVEPSSEDVDLYIQKIRQTEQKNPAILDIHVDESLIAGAEVVVDGKVTDGSLKKKLASVDWKKILGVHLAV